jgi:hypothetical protein
MYLKRRDLLRAALTAGAVTGAIGMEALPTGRSKKDERGKKRSQYQPDSVEVQTFYRVNRYPVK